MNARFAVAVSVAVFVSVAVTYVAQAEYGGVIPYATGTQTIQSGPGVYAQTTSEYSGSWSWTQQSASYDYYWYVFTSGGTLVGNDHNVSGGGGSWSGAANIYYFKEYNNEPAGSGHLNILQATFCC